MSTVPGMADRWAVISDWDGQVMQLDVYRAEDGIPIFGEWVHVAKGADLFDTATARLKVAGMRVGDWQPDGDGWRADVENRADPGRDKT